MVTPEEDHGSDEGRGDPSSPGDGLVMTLLEQTLKQPAHHRGSFLERACDGNPDLYQDVWRRVESDDRMRGFLLAPLLPALLAEDAFEAGELLNGRFRVIRSIAHGGMGIVYEAWDETLEKRVALKCARAQFRRRLPPEVRHATEIAHPNVCRVFEIHTARRDGVDIDFLTMEFLEGPTLAHRLLQGPLPPAGARQIAFQMCNGLAEAHRRGVVHGDLKAHNVILAELNGATLRVVITDFGLAQGLRAAGTAGLDAAGTPDYMAPELWTGTSVSIASDIYALGVLLHELAFARRPGQPANASAGSFRTSLPPAYRPWNRVITRCLNADPRRRYRSVDDVLAALRPAHRRPAIRAAAVGMVVLLALWAGGFINASYRGQAVQSVAVMPFVNEAVASGNLYVAEGIAESLIHSLAQFPSLNVIARTSSFQFADHRNQLSEVARRLHASLIVTGRVRQVGGHLIVGAELVNPTAGTHLWGAQYDLDTTTLRGAEEDIARRIAEQVGARLSVASVGNAQRDTVRSQAYELLLRGQYQRRLYTPESRQQAVGLFEQALAVDPQFALAHAELANIYRLLAGGGIVDPAEAMPKAEAAAQRALASDANLAEAHAALADIWKDRWQWAAAEREYRTSIALKPSLADAHMGYAILLSVTGRYQPALAELRKVRLLDPVGLPAALHAAAVHYNARQYAAALDELARARALDPAAPSPWMWTGMVLGGSGRYAEAVHAYRDSFSRGDRTAATRSFYVYALAKSGKREEARGVLDEILKSGEFVPLTALAVAYAGLDQADKTIELLQRAYARPDPILQYLKVESHYDSVKDRPEYLDLGNRMQLP